MTTYQAYNDGVSGGLNFAITYTPGQNDPAGKDVRWMQVIDTNMPSARGTAYGVAGTGTNGIPSGDTAYLDNAGPGANGTPVDPYYGWLTATNTTDITTSTAANANGFTDTPRLPLVDGRQWEAQAFVTSESDLTVGFVTYHDVAIYGGVWYGFQDAVVPVPAAVWSGALLLAGLGAARVMRRQAA